MKIRPFWVLIHRYAGLSMTVFLIIVGLTGSLLAFYAELERAINPRLQVEAHGRKPLDLPALMEQAEHLAPQAQLQSVWLSDGAAHVSMSPRNDPASGQPYALNFDQLILNPYTGEELGRRQWGDISQGWINLMPFIYKLHYALALNDLGVWILGITALIWTLDCFVGFYLTFPPGKRAPRLTTKQSGKFSEAVVAGDFTSGERTFWQRWRPAWLIKWQGSAYRVNFDLHRAGGLWLWLALLAFAWSSVYMNLGATVYKPVMQAVSDFHEPWTDIADLEQPLEHPALTWKDAYRIGNEAMIRAAALHDFRVEAPIAIWLDRAKGFYVYTVRGSIDFQDHGGHTQVAIDANSGEQKMLVLPSGQYNGSTITHWLAALHMANVFGLPYRIFVCLLGLAIVMLSVTGVVIWLKKRRARNFRKQRQPFAVKTLQHIELAKKNVAEQPVANR